MDIKTEQLVFDVDFARRQFPFFDVTPSKEWAFFDSAGGTLPCRSVIKKLDYFYRFNKVQPHGDSALAFAAGEQMDQGRRSMADLLGVPSDTLTIGASTTQNLNTLSLACADFLTEKDEIIVSEQDHEANIGSWERAAKQTGATLRIWQVNKDNGELELADLEKLLNRNTKIICVTHSSNIIGTVNPIDQIIDMGHAFEAKVVIDGVSFAPHQWPDLSSSKADAYCFSTYKTYATHQGILYVVPDFLNLLTPQCHFLNDEIPWLKLDSSGPDHASIAALAGLETYFKGLYDHHFKKPDLPLNTKAAMVSALMHRHETSLCEYLLKHLAQLPVKIFGKTSMQNRESNVALISKNHTSAQFAVLLAKKGIATKNSHFYAPRLIKKMRLGLDDGLVRLSFAHYNTMAETQKLITALEDIFS